MRGVSVWLIPVLCNSRPSVIIHSACGGVDIDCRGQLANRLLGAHGVRQGAVATWYDQGATVGFINIGDGGQYVDGERAPESSAMS